MNAKEKERKNNVEWEIKTREVNHQLLVIRSRVKF